MAQPTLLRAQDRALAELTRAIYLGETAKALALIKPGLALDHVAREIGRAHV